MKLPPPLAPMLFAILRVQRLVRDEDNGKNALAAFKRAAAILERFGAIVVQQDLIVQQHAAHQRRRFRRAALAQLRDQCALDVPCRVHALKILSPLFYGIIERVRSRQKTVMRACVETAHYFLLLILGLGPLTVFDFVRSSDW